MLPVNFRVELEFRAQFRNQLRVSLKNKVHIKSAVEFPSLIRELPLIHFLHLLDFCPLLLKLGFQPVDHVFDGVVFSLRIQHEERFVTIHHDSSALLNLFIADVIPLSTAHLIASAARSIIAFTFGFSSSKNGEST